MKYPAFLVILALLAGCGVDGLPERPAAPGVSVTGHTVIGASTEL